MGKSIFKTSTGSMHLALFIVRVGFGVFYMFQGFPGITIGVETLSWLGGSMRMPGIGFAPALLSDEIFPYCICND